MFSGLCSSTRNRRSDRHAPGLASAPAVQWKTVAAATLILGGGAIALGACLGAGLAGRFGGPWRVHPRLVAAGLIGGFLLGYGARIAHGCNSGALFSGIASTSLHGWLWGAAALLGTPVGVRVRTVLRPH